MAITKNSGRQCPIVSNTKITFGTGKDVAATGFYPAVDLPQNAVVIDGWLVVSDATTASATAAVGPSTAPTSYLAATAIDATGKTDLTISGLVSTSPVTLGVTIAGANPVATGEAELVVIYYVNGRAEFSQG